MSEGEKIVQSVNSGEKKEKEKSRRTEFRLRQVVIVSIAFFITFCCCILFFFLVYRYNGFTDYWAKLSYILQPVIIGVVLAYLLNPIVNVVEEWAKKGLAKFITSKKKIKSLSRMLGITGAWLFFVVIIAVLVAAILPSITESILSMIKTFPDAVNNLITWIDELAQDDGQIATVINEAILQVSGYFEGWMKNTLLPQMESYIASITSGVFAIVKLVMNIFVGFIISVYVLTSKEKFAGQAKKIVYAIFKPTQANVIVDTIRKSHEIFGGFISGKLLDSLIIGILAYIVLSIMKMPYTMLVSVIIGVTNVIPFFGPFIGAVPSFFIIVLQNPIKGLYFLIFIFVLQQIDGNIIGPKILGNSTGLSSFWVVFAITLFGGLWGFVGMLLGVPLTAVIYYIAGRVLGYMLRKRGIPDDTESYVKLRKIDKKTNQPIYGKK